MKKIVITLFLLATVISIGAAQVTYKLTTLDPVPLGAKVDPMQVEDGYSPIMKFEEPPKHYETRVDKAKEISKELYPRKKSTALSSRGLVDPPMVVKSFETNLVNGTPTDNSLGISSEGVNVSAVNRSIQFRDNEGKFIRNFDLNSFAQGLSFGNNMFDPRVIYDAEADRFCIVWLAGTASATSSIIVAFSSSPNVIDPWNLYEIDGSPFGPGTWTDYPMISLTNEKLILTANLIRDAEPWETGFAQTIIHQIDKTTAYEGADNLTVDLYSDIKFNGKAIRNLHPVKSADGSYDAEQYFLSNRNFDVQNDTIFIIKLLDPATDPIEQIEIDFRIADLPYGVPPNGKQIGGKDLSTNDARILDAFRMEDHIQFVGNTIDTSTGQAAIYHGFLDDLNDSKALTTTLITHPTRDLGYPGIAWTGESEDQQDAIVVAEHSGLDIYTGFSAVYMDEERDYSDWVDVSSGEGVVDGFGTTLRWGDYIGCQREYGKPGVVWVSSMSAKSNGTSKTFNAMLTAPGKPLSSIETQPWAEPKLSVVPNPTSERILVTMDIPHRAELVMAIYDMQGREVALLFYDITRKIGKLNYSFDLGPLDSGVYLFRAILGDKEIATQKIVKE